MYKQNGTLDCWSYPRLSAMSGIAVIVKLTTEAAHVYRVNIFGISDALIYDVICKYISTANITDQHSTHMNENIKDAAWKIHRGEPLST